VVQAAGFSVAELVVKYWHWAHTYYRDDDGQPTRELENLKDALRPLRQLYGHTAAQEFGSLALRALQEHLVASGLCRNVVNYRINRIKRVFKWATSFELLPVSVHEALCTVPGLRRGRGQARETERVQPCRWIMSRRPCLGCRHRSPPWCRSNCSQAAVRGKARS
jgi:hypothetical protein